ncbi:hypothetical protein ACDY97_31950 [Rhizobium mongolense]|uniref:PD-(D/E)XK nuclease domain-containing protein n=1 Tax=Rhizobium mongolense TaxID=57676 RepID=UPI0035590BC2
MLRMVFKLDMFTPVCESDQPHGARLNGTLERPGMTKKDKEDKHSGPWEIVQASIEACRQQLLQCERTSKMVQDEDGEYYTNEEFEHRAEYLGYLLRKTHVKMQLLIEKTGYVHFLRQYKKGFDAFENVTELTPVPEEPDYLISDPLDYIETAFSSLSEIVIGLDDNKLELAMVERVLRNAPYIVKDFKADPHSEKDIKATMLKFLQRLFADARHEVKISHVFKTYKADIGIGSLKALIEVKYAQDESELKAELDGIYADMKGYAGDDRWVNFFALIYTTEPIATQERIEAEYALAKVDMSWKPIIVHGTGDRVKPQKKFGRATKDKCAT